jgi:hypothetical protein
MRLHRTLTVLSLVLPAAVAMPAAAQQQNDEQAVIAVVQKLFDGMRARDTVMMKSTFAPGAQLLGLAQRDGSESMRASPAAQFVSGIAGAPAGEFIERVYEPEVKIDGNLASYWAYYTFHVGDRFSHCGVDAVLLFKFADGWKIASIADTRRQDPCEHRTPSS